MKRIVLGIVTAGFAALALGAAPAHAEEYNARQHEVAQVQVQPAQYYRYDRDFRERERERERYERLRRERMRRMWLMRHGYLRDRW